MSLTAVMAASAGLSSLGTYLGAREARKGAEAGARASLQGTRESLALQKRMWEYGVEAFKPYKEAGEFGLGRYLEGLKDPTAFQRTPGYQFRLREGLKAIGIPDGSSRGLSGRQLQAAMRYGQDYATSEYDRYLARYGSLVDVGRGVATSTAGAAQQYGASAGDTAMRGGMAAGQYAQQGGAARASAYIGMANIGAQTAQNYMMYQMMQPQYPQGDAYMPGALYP